jgi:SAM-dependent methyltransferase
VSFAGGDKMGDRPKGKAFPAWRRLRILDSPLAWRLSGTTFPTAVLATSGRVMTASDYLRSTAIQMELISNLIPPRSSVLELGSGLGGNLIALSRWIAKGVGVDINAGYGRLAIKLAKRAGAENLTFSTFDGRNLEVDGQEYDFIFSLGVFERLPHSQVESLVAQLGDRLAQSGVCALYFLSPEALETDFIRLLPRRAYAPWAPSQVEELLHRSSMIVRAVIPWGLARQRDGRGAVAVAHLYVSRVA